MLLEGRDEELFPFLSLAVSAELQSCLVMVTDDSDSEHRTLPGWLCVDRVHGMPGT